MDKPTLARKLLASQRSRLESEVERIDRLGRERRERDAAFDARVEARRAAGIPDKPCSMLPAFGEERWRRERITRSAA